MSTVTAGPQAPLPVALDPGALEDSFLPLLRAHERRVAALAEVVDAEHALSQALEAAVGIVGQPPPPPAGLLERALAALGLADTLPPVPPVEPQVRYEAALRALQAVGHQLGRLESEQVLLDQDLRSCRERSARAAADRERVRAALADHPGRPSLRLQAQRFDAERQRADDMITLQEELVPVLARVHGSVSSLHRAARGVVGELARQLADDALAAADTQLHAGLATRATALRDTVREVRGLVDEGVRHVDRERDSLHRRLRLLDAEAEARRAAAAELDALLAERQPR